MMTQPTSHYRDLLVLKNDLDLTAINSGTFIEDRECIAQDLIHAVRESGLLEQLIAERSQPLSRFIIDDLRRVIEADGRIVPGSVALEKTQDQLHLAAATEFGPVAQTFEISL